MDDIVNRPRTRVSILTGDGADQVALRLVNSTNFYAGDPSIADPRTGKWQAAYNFDIDLGGTELYIDLGDGADSAEISGGVSMLQGRNLLKTFSQLIAKYYPDDSLSGLEKSEYTIVGGAGDDSVTLSTTSAFADFFGLNVNLEEAEDGGYDRLHLEGELATTDIYADGSVLPSIPYEERIYYLNDDEGNQLGLGLRAQASISVAEGLLGDVAGVVVDPVSLQQTLNIHYNSSNLEAVTDLLENKRTVDLTGLVSEGAARPQTVEYTGSSFTDYLLSDRINPADELTINSLIVNILGDSNFMSNLIAMAAGVLNVNGLEAEGLNLFLIAPEINIDNSLKGLNIVMTAQAEDPSALGPSSPLTQTVIEDELTNTQLTYGVDVYDVNASAKVTIAEGLRDNRLRPGGHQGGDIPDQGYVGRAHGSGGHRHQLHDGQGPHGPGLHPGHDHFRRLCACFGRLPMSVSTPPR